MNNSFWKQTSIPTSAGSTVSNHAPFSNDSNMNAPFTGFPGIQVSFGEAHVPDSDTSPREVHSGQRHHSPHVFPSGVSIPSYLNRAPHK